MPQGKGSRYHNLRLYEKNKVPENIDSSRTQENLVLVDRELTEAYKDIFGKALDEYNSKQKRSDRKILDYCEHIKKSKNGEQLFYEDVVQWGSKDDFIEDPGKREIAKQCLIEYFETFKKANPQLVIIGAYIHMDEASPHLHIDYIPVATGYKRGLSKRNSLDKAMKQMGYVPGGKQSKTNNATQVWKASERARFGKICQNHGLEVEQEQQWGRKNLSVTEYKQAKDEMLSSIEREQEAKLNTLSELQKSVSERKTEISDLEFKKNELEAQINSKKVQIEELDKKKQEIEIRSPVVKVRENPEVKKALDQFIAKEKAIKSEKLDEMDRDYGLEYRGLGMTDPLNDQMVEIKGFRKDKVEMPLSLWNQIRTQHNELVDRYKTLRDKFTERLKQMIELFKQALNCKESVMVNKHNEFVHKYEDTTHKYANLKERYKTQQEDHERDIKGYKDVIDELFNDIHQREDLYSEAIGFIYEHDLLDDFAVEKDKDIESLQTWIPEEQIEKTGHDEWEFDL